MKKQLDAIKKEFQEAIRTVQDFADLEQLEQKFFSRKSGMLTTAMKELKDFSVEEKAKFGKMANMVKQSMQELLEEKEEQLEAERLANIETEEAIDVTQDLRTLQETGHLHPITQARWKLEETARTMGFLIEDGPELESDYYVFASLNIPKDHPARDGQDTFYIKGKPEWCMRSHVSNMQVRLMRKYGAPLRAAHPGRVFRNEAIDATHGHTFYQFDALVVDKNLSVGDLVGTIQALLQGYFHKEVKLRLRPAHFPFVEPGFEMDMHMTYMAGGKEKTKWLEIVGCGLVHPHVLKEGGLDPDEWDGYAFSFGIDRLVMDKYGIEDIRHLHGGDLRFLTQF